MNWPVLIINIVLNLLEGNTEIDLKKKKSIKVCTLSCPNKQVYFIN